jgi:hypothetical protein
MATAKPKPKTKKKAVLKTTQNNADVGAFISSVADETKRKDSEALLKLFKQVTKEKPKMWGSSIVGFGSYVYESPATGRTGDWFMTGFSPRKQNFTIYIISGFGAHAALLKKLGKFKISGGSCLYFNKLSDLDQEALKELVTTSYQQMKTKYSGKK